MEKLNDLSGKIIAAAIEVHRHLGPGLLESSYEECTKYELEKSGLLVQRQVTVPVIYKEITLECGYRIDLIVNDRVIVELKSVDALLPVHEAQILTYMKFAKKELGLLINFNVSLLKNGIRRFKL
ncbi:MAG TPA: GxxExxY protein [Bacteroidota bacterium]